MYSVVRKQQDQSTTVHLVFKVSYLTEWGQNLVLKARNIHDEKSVTTHPMNCRWEGKRLVWETVVTLSELKDLQYNYVVMNEENLEEKSETVMRRLSLSGSLESGQKAEIFDTWQDRSSPYEAISANAFRRAIGFGKQEINEERTVPREVAGDGQIIVRFIVRDLISQDGHEMYVTGGLPSLGNWQQDKVFKLTERHSSIWEGEVLVPWDKFPFTYKYAVSNERGMVLETGESRFASLQSDRVEEDYPTLVTLEDGHFRHEKLWKGAGIAVPVFSLRSSESMGIGEFLDLNLLIDFCVNTGFQVIQILPINDTSVHMMWWDSYPYNSLSVFALHPIYLRIDASLLGLIDPSDPIHSEHGSNGLIDLPTEIKAAISEAKDRLDQVELDYEDTVETKMKIALEVYKLNGQKTLKSSAFIEFFKKNANWLAPYAAFIYLRNLFQTSEHWNWGLLACPTPEDIARLVSPESPQYFLCIGFTYWIQFHLHLQLSSVKNYAEANGVALKGDLPIGVDKRSVDTWMFPNLFRMDKSTGAPPDYFDANGQNWGFPTYNWEEMEKDNFQWWRNRLSKMEEYFHAYRIDHILGFFRIWEIPGKSNNKMVGMWILDDCAFALLGNFRPSIPLTRQELESKGIWDFDRLCKPHLPWKFLQKVFGDLADEVSVNYLREVKNRVFEFRDQYNSEKQIQKIESSRHLQWLESEITTIKKGLLKCIQNVVLIRHPQDESVFYPRFQLMSTESYGSLDVHWRMELKALHDDYYFHRQNTLWRKHALKTLPVLMNASDMLVCGEDLGMIPSCVHPVMEELGLIGMRIQRMPSSESEFGDPSEYSYLTVCCASCHDVSTTRAWWEEDTERAHRLFRTFFSEKDNVSELCTPQMMQKIVQQHFQSPSVLAILPIQDIFALSDDYNDRDPASEAINDPTNPKHYWRYRIHVQLETLVKDDSLAGLLKSMLKTSNRGSNYWMGKRCWTRSNGSKVWNS
eukprot:g4629.t1